MFRFTIRDVLWLTVVVGLGVGWWGDQLGLRAQRSTLWNSNYNLRVLLRIREEQIRAFVPEFPLTDLDNPDYR